MTRAQIADPDLVAKLRAGQPERIRPCTRCNQTCQVRDARNPLVTCIGEPTSGRETEDPDWYAPAQRAARRRRRRRRPGRTGDGAGRRDPRPPRRRSSSATPTLGGLAAVAGPNRPLVDWLAARGRAARRRRAHRHRRRARRATAIVQCTGSIAGRPRVRRRRRCRRASTSPTLRRGAAALPDDGDVVVYDPIGGPIGVALAEELGARAVLVTQDNIAGNELARTGDLAPANVRLAQAGVRIERRSLLRARRAPAASRSRDRYSGAERAAAVRRARRLRVPPADRAAARRRRPQAGDCVAPRTVHEAILEGRRAARCRVVADVRVVSAGRGGRRGGRTCPWTPAPGGVDAEHR